MIPGGRMLQQGLVPPRNDEFGMNWRWTLLIVLCCRPVVAAEPLPWPETAEPGAVLVEILGDERFFGGPTWDPASQSLFITAFSKTNQQILRLDSSGQISIWIDQTAGINGTFLSNSGRLLATQAFGHRVMSYGLGTNGPVDIKTLLFDPTLHQPNDLCQTPKGDIYFTDPDFKERKTSAVYRIAPNGLVTREITDLAVPNGIIASPTGRFLYVADSDAKLWMVYPIQKTGALGTGSVFFKPETASTIDPDGMSMDEEGNVYLTGMGGVWVVHPKGRLLGFIPLSEVCSNLAFGGIDGKTLYITCSSKLYSLRMKVHGAHFGKRLWQIFRSAD